MLTLDEAIAHCEEKAKELRADAELFKRVKATSEKIKDCKECANEHEQLAKWLKELKAWRELRLVCGFDGYVVYKCKESNSETVN